MQTILKNIVSWRVLLGILVGAIAGYGYGYYVGCNGGTCPLTSNPFNTAAYFALFGGLFMYKPNKKQEG